MARRNGSGIALLADPLRLRIIALLALAPRRSSLVARQLGISRSSATRQLHLLRDAGLVVSMPGAIDRRQVVYMIPSGKLRVITAWLAGTRIGLDEPHPVFDIELRERASTQSRFELIADNRNDVDNPDLTNDPVPPSSTSLRVTASIATPRLRT
jgi:DNA-binding transcriptional ArsR family regulator